MTMETPRYQVLEEALKQSIQSGRWHSGERLPSIRVLCQRYGLSKITVQHALQRLEAQGLVEARERSGFFITPSRRQFESPKQASRIDPPQVVSVSQVFQDIMTRSAAFDLLPNPHGAEPPPGITQLNRCIGRALRRQKGSFQYYDEPAGDGELRHQLALRSARRGWNADADDFCITSGCQQALFLALMAACQSGDVVAVEAPGFYGVLQLIEQLQLKVVEIPASPQTGMDISALEKTLESWDVKACVVSPSFATPGGAIMPPDARQRLLELADRHELAVIEDDIYAESGWLGVPDTLKAIDTSDRVIHCSSFSKVLSRDLRMGWVSGGRWHSKIRQLKLTSQLASSRFLQEGVAEFITEGGYTAFLRRYRQSLRLQRDQLLELLGNWPVPLRATTPRGGLTLWVELPEEIDTLRLYSRTLAEGIVITPGSLFSVSGRFGNCLRISYAHPWTADRTAALERLPELIA
ncbi:aminotransferase-like domain-containing protein [Marinobacter sp. F4206]|uniref:aminotransferase-like domain-containing protein n=1 Tax=Marinobacter sp. F4206 TaxID=2861777 RepID=UPI001C5E01FD|nr:PLP-dependent aminotransferase family protein [Marinobacter sp. F4206]MBW4933143.1 PLP-dependent aminotransferase family protein [Marinobacter sp. F4206]